MVSLLPADGTQNQDFHGRRQLAPNAIVYILLGLHDTVQAGWGDAGYQEDFLQEGSLSRAIAGDHDLTSPQALQVPENHGQEGYHEDEGVEEWRCQHHGHQRQPRRVGMQGRIRVLTLTRFVQFQPHRVATDKDTPSAKVSEEKPASSSTGRSAPQGSSLVHEIFYRPGGGSASKLFQQSSRYVA